MASIAAFDDFALGENRALLASCGIHGLLIVCMALFANVDIFKADMQPQLAIEATLVSPDSLVRAPKPKPEPEPLPAPEVIEPAPELIEPEPEPAPEPEVDEQAMREQALKEQQREQQLKLEREAAARKDRERKAAEQKQREETARKEQERKAAEQQERERKAAEEARRKEQQRRQAELMAALEAEEAQVAAVQSGDLARWSAMIGQKTERNWVKPPSAPAQLNCEVFVSQLPSGEVIDVRIGSCNGDDALKRSVETAVRRASPLPLPDNPAVFDRNLRFIFNPQQ